MKGADLMKGAGLMKGVGLMNVWRLEWLRLVRTHRLLVMISVYVFFGLTGPLTARYLSEIINRLDTSGVRVELPEPQPADGIDQFVGNAAQLGLLVVVLVAGSALAFDARREMAIFLRTRVRSVRAVLIPAYVVNTAAAVAGLLAGALAAWYETSVLLGALPPGRMVLGMALGAVFLAFVVAVVAFAAGLVRSTVATAGLTLGILIIMAIIGGLGGVGRWLPTSLSSALVGLVRGADPAEYVPAAVAAVVIGAAALVAATVLGSRREL